MNSRSSSSSGAPNNSVLGPEAAARLRRSLWSRLNEFVLSTDDGDEEDHSHDLHVAKCFEKCHRPPPPTNQPSTKKKLKRGAHMERVTRVRQRESPGGILRLLVSIDRAQGTTEEMKKLIQSFTLMLMNGRHVGDLCGIECDMKSLSNIMVFRGQSWQSYEPDNDVVRQ